jgi:hypothetical protein
MAERFWSDDFDMDLLKVIPGVAEALGDHADTPLWTYGNTSHDRINSPSCWNTYTGLAAFFGTDDSGQWKPSDYSTQSPMVACTWLETVRDAWAHGYTAVVNGHPIWDAGRLTDQVFNALMYDLRNWTKLPPGRGDQLRTYVAIDLSLATERLAAIVKQVNEPDDPATDAWVPDGEGWF